MRRLLMIVLVAALVFTGFGPAHADDPSATESITVACKGTGGYEEGTSFGDLWKFDRDWIGDDSWTITSFGHPACVVWAPGSAGPIEVPPGNIFTWTQFLPLGTWGDMGLSGAGDFACGNGSLTAEMRTHNTIVYNQGPAFVLRYWDLDWSTELTDGVGEISGTATLIHTDENVTRDISGTIVIDDGAAAGACDDSAGNSEVLITFTLE